MASVLLPAFVECQVSLEALSRGKTLSALVPLTDIVPLVTVGGQDMALEVAVA